MVAPWLKIRLPGTYLVSEPPLRLQFWTMYVHYIGISYTDVTVMVQRVDYCVWERDDTPVAFEKSRNGKHHVPSVNANRKMVAICVILILFDSHKCH